MLSWIGENLGTILVGLILAAVVAGILVRMIRNRKKGKSSCGCGCASCRWAMRVRRKINEYCR